MEFTARITMPDGRVVEKTVEVDGGAPIGELDLGNVDAFVKAFDGFEKSIIRADNEMKTGILDEYMSVLEEKKEKGRNPDRRDFEMEVGRLAVPFAGSATKDLKPKEMVVGISFCELSFKLAAKMSYSESAKFLDRVLHRGECQRIVPMTHRNRVEREGRGLMAEYDRISETVLSEYGITSGIGGPIDGVLLPERVSHPKLPACVDRAVAESISSAYNKGSSPEASIKEPERIASVEATPTDTVYVSVNGIGVKRQKESRKPGSGRESKYVENNVIHIQSEESTYCLTADGMQKALRMLLAFLLSNGLLEDKRLVFITDGATNIKDHIAKFFGFRQYTLLLDWLHLEKKSREYLSMALRGGKEEKSAVSNALLGMLWVGNVEDAQNYIRKLDDKLLKNKGRAEEMVGYLERKKDYIPCYALRKALGLRNSSNPVEKANDIYVAKRQKHNGMSWSPNGSAALAVITAIYSNGELSHWLNERTLNFKMAA